MPSDVTLQAIAAGCGAQIPFPGSGDTATRFAALADCASDDLSLGRLAEGHIDALAILHEAGKAPIEPGLIYGVWAARSGSGGTSAHRGAGGWYLSGTKPFCSGSGLIERALVTADSPDGYRLFDIAVADNVTHAQPDSWVAVGMADSLSSTLEFGGPALPESWAIGGPGFYLDRPGFWHGAVGVAACWYGGARGLVDRLSESLAASCSDVVAAELGHARAHVAAMHAILDQAARAIDEDPDDHRAGARERALAARHAVHESCQRVLEHVAAGGGARPLCHDRAQGQRAADLYVYLAQHHGPQDAVALGRLGLDRS
jgi:alkylation response protein AidB-like acyl-CoA dehydrogenase